MKDNYVKRHGYSMYSFLCIPGAFFVWGILMLTLGMNLNILFFGAVILLMMQTVFYERFHLPLIEDIGYLNGMKDMLERFKELRKKRNCKKRGRPRKVKR